MLLIKEKRLRIIISDLFQWDRREWIVLFFFLAIQISQAQIIDSIAIEGNKRTKDKIILNELFFKVGDHYDKEFSKKAEHSQSALMRLNIFTDVEITSIHEPGKHLIIVVSVRELWPLYPIPQFDIIDRSYTVWIKEHGASIDRVLYGLNLTHINTTGRADQLNLDWQLGFQRKGKLEYDSPPLTKNQKLRMKYRIDYSSSRDIDIGITGDNELIRLRDESKSLLKELNYGTKIIYRHTREFSFEGDINFTHLNYIDTIQTINPEFYSASSSWHDSWHGKLVYDSRSNTIFATSGSRFELEYARTGIIKKDLFSQSFKFNWIQAYLFPNEKIGMLNDFRLGLRDWNKKSFYYFQKGISRDLSDLRAYETAFIPGEGYVMNRSKLFAKIVDREYTCYPNWIKKYVSSVPYQLYLSLNFDTAYIRNNDQPTDLNNTWLYSWGPSLEFVFFNNFKFAVDYSLDRNGESVFNFNFDTSF